MAVIDVSSLTRRFGDRTVVDAVSFTVGRGEIFGLLGPNGSGKSTLVQTILGRLQPETGRAHLGPSVVVGEIEQARTQLDSLTDGAAPFGQAFAEAVGWTTTESRSLLAKFGLGAEHVARPPSSLSPGERTRAVLALLAARGANLLVLDEPTNHLDLDTKDMLVKALADYGGTMLFVSHDRRFLTEVSNRVLELGSDDGPRVYDGGYAEYVESTQCEAPGMR